MAITNRERIGKALDLLKEGLAPFVQRELENQYGKYWITEVTAGWPHEPDWTDDGEPHLDIALLLRLMWEQWNPVFRQTLGHAERSLVSELRDVRNRWAHQNRFSSDDTYRALDSASRLLTAISAPQARELDRMKNELLRVRYDEQMRNERRKIAATPIQIHASAHLKPWREVVTPHPDVASGRYHEADFAADLWQVHLGEGPSEYRDPVEFFRRTYLTESLRKLLVGAIRRLSGKGGDPVVQLQTNFGGGKTHSMLALYHLFSDTSPSELPGIDGVMQDAEVDLLPKVRRVVLVGNKISPGNPSTKPDGTVVRTLWGELAWQLGGREAYEQIRADDEQATSPGDRLRTLFNEYGPCLILIDEWVAYARMLHDESDLPAGSFETQFTFAQALTESAKLAKDCLLVISLPASDTASSPYAQVDDAEVGGQRGREALHRLQNIIGRVEASWRPATAEEGFEIVRRRLFEPLTSQEQFVARDTVARSFHELYSNHSQEFPPECREAEYERRIQAAYPIHPEVFDRLYTDWSTLVKFQRTRGVLRLMAAVIHSLWERGDRSPLILPANIPIDDPRITSELDRYLPDNWIPIIEKDVDGSNSLPLNIDNHVGNLGKFGATRRVARTIFLGSAPTHDAANRGLEDRRINLGCVMPGETPAVFGDALRRLASNATYLYQDGTRYWYSTQPTVTKLAEDRAEQLRRDPDAVIEEIRARVQKGVKELGAFSRVHVFPASSQDVPDDLDARLVVLGVDCPHSRDDDTPALRRAREFLDNRGNSPRIYKNTLVFLAADQTRLQDLDEAVRMYLAWKSIVDDKETLDLSPQQVRQAENRLKSADGTVKARIPETFQWLLVPVQEDPRAGITWETYRLTGQESLAVRAAQRLRKDERLLSVLAGTLLRMEIDKVPLWRGNHVSVRQLVEDFARYLYLPRLTKPDVLYEAIRDGVRLLSWDIDGFAYADAFDESTGRYRGLRVLNAIHLSDDGLVVRPDVASAQLKAESQISETAATEEGRAAVGESVSADYRTGSAETSYALGPEPEPEPAPVLKRFYGSVNLDPARVGRDAALIGEEVISHLVALVGAEVEVTLEIEAKLPGGVPEHVVRVVTENSRALKFKTQGFEPE